MPRPPSHRQVARDLREGLFGPRGRPLPGVDSVELTLDELEALRLSDLVGLYQEAAAERMAVSRATFARILAGARRTVADALVNGKMIDVGGGAVQRRAKGDWPCPVHGEERRRGRGCRCGGGGRGRGRGQGRDGVGRERPGRGNPGGGSED